MPYKDKRLKNKRGYVIKVERILGHELPQQAVVHHVDGNRNNNENTNLVVCQDQAYHLYLHVRTRAYKATGDVNKRQCQFCNEWDRIGLNRMRSYSCGNSYRTYHMDCFNQQQNERRRAVA